MKQDFRVEVEIKDRSQPYRVMKGNTIYYFTNSRKEAERMIEIFEKEEQAKWKKTHSNLKNMNLN